MVSEVEAESTRRHANTATFVVAAAMMVARVRADGAFLGVRHEGWWLTCSAAAIAYQGAPVHICITP
jgi:hypothetical protein